MSRIVFVPMAIAGIVHIVFFAGPQMTGASPLVVAAFGAVVAAVALTVEHRDNRRRQRKAGGQPGQTPGRGAPRSSRDDGRTRVA